MTTSDDMASEPDREHTKEIVRMLKLAVAQIEMAMREAESSIDTLSHSLTNMAVQMREIEQQVKERVAGDKNIDIEQCEAVSNEIQRAMVAMQFYDRLKQRLSHVSHALHILAELTGDQHRVYNADEWMSLQDAIKSHYAMPEEFHIFELIMQGMAPEEIIHHIQKMEHDDSVELF